MRPVTITDNSNHSGVEVLRGVAIYEDAGAAAMVWLRKASASGQKLIPVPLAAGEAVFLGLDGTPIPSEGGVYVEVVSGSIDGVLYGD